jgi:NitT/TauT family transport system permease protein
MRRPTRLLAARVLGEGHSPRQRVTVTILSLAGLVAIWELLVVSGVTTELALPRPEKVLESLVEFRAPIASSTWVTLKEVLLGFAGAVLLGMILAMGLTYSRIFNAAVYPPLLILHALPKVAFAPLLLIWLGFGLAPKIVLSVTLAFFPILISTITGLRSVDPELHELARTWRASWMQTFLKIDFPNALPSFFAGMRAATHLAVTGAVIAEFVSGGDGLAFLLHSASGNLQVELAFAIAIVISLMSTLLFGVVALVERVAIPWAYSESMR